MFRLIPQQRNGVAFDSLEHIASGARYDLPDNTKQVAVDQDGEIYAYESGMAKVETGHTGWTDNGYDGFVKCIGKIPGDVENMPKGVFPGWRDSLTSIDALRLSPEYGVRDAVAVHAQPGGSIYEMAIAISPPRLDGSQLRAKVTEMLDRRMKSGIVGATRARHFLSDIRSEGFTFENYRTADLVMVLLAIGCDLKLTRDYAAFRAIDDAVHEIWGAK